jgi:hypothetical protein
VWWVGIHGSSFHGPSIVNKSTFALHFHDRVYLPVFSYIHLLNIFEDVNLRKSPGLLRDHPSSGDLLIMGLLTTEVR